MATLRHTEPWQTHVLNNKWEVGNCQCTTWFTHRCFKSVTLNRVRAFDLWLCPDYINVLDFLHISHAQNGVKLSKKIGPPPTRKKTIHLFHTYSPCHILLCLPKAFRDEHHLMPELVCTVQSGS